MAKSAHVTLRTLVEDALEGYFANLEDQNTAGVYKMVIREVEMGLLKVVLKRTRGNQSTAASILGLARGTLRRRLLEYGLE